MRLLPIVNRVTFAAACIYSRSVSGGPPLETDDPYTPGAVKWEINMATTMEKRGDSWEFTSLLDVNYGLGERGQIKLKPRFVVLDEPQRERRSGVGNIQAGLKWRFLDETTHGLSVSAYPQIDVNPPTDSARRGIIARGTELLFPVQVGRAFGDTLLYAEAGFRWRENGQDGWLAGVACEQKVAKRLRLVAELRTTGESELCRTELFFNGGFKFAVHPRMTLLGSAGRTIVEPTQEFAGVFSYLAAQFTF